MHVIPMLSYFYDAIDHASVMVILFYSLGIVYRYLLFFLVALYMARERTRTLTQGLRFCKYAPIYTPAAQSPLLKSNLFPFLSFEVHKIGRARLVT